MKNGFNKIEAVLRRYGMRTGDAIGTVWSSGNAISSYLTKRGYTVEDGTSHPTYDYIVLGRSKSNLENVLKSLTKLNSNGILVCIVEDRWVAIQERNN